MKRILIVDDDAHLATLLAFAARDLTWWSSTGTCRWWTAPPSSGNVAARRAPTSRVRWSCPGRQRVRSAANLARAL